MRSDGGVMTMQDDAPQVLFLTLYDWANSAYEAAQAVNFVGDISTRHVSFYRHPVDYPTDVRVPVLSTTSPIAAMEHISYKALRHVLSEVDMIHLWNCEWRDFYNSGLLGRRFLEPVPIPVEKVRSVTHSGTFYRKNHHLLNERYRIEEVALAWEDPCFGWDGELQGEFIPHAIDTDSLAWAPIEDRKPKVIGCYNADRDCYRDDLALLQRVLSERYPDYTLDIRSGQESHQDYIKAMSGYSYFFQSMWTETGTYGRSALEACSMGIPTFSYISDKAKRHGERGGFNDPAIISVTPETLGNELDKAFSGEGRADYDNQSRRCREWVVKHYGYAVVGRLYTEFFRKLMQ